MNSVELHFIVLTKVSDTIVGDNGKNIRKIRDESSASVNLSDGIGVDRILSIRGTLTQVGKAVEMVADRLSKLEGSPIVTLTLATPNSQCGPLIGRGGQKIKEICKFSGAQITVPSDTLPGSRERAVKITGNPPSLGKAITEISKVFIDFPAR